MKKSFFLVVISLYVFTFCTGKSSEESTDSKKNGTDLYCYIKSLSEKDGTYYLDVNFIDFYWDEEAAEVAKARGDAYMEVTEDGDSLYSVNNDYYIVNDDKTIFTYAVAKDASVTLLSQSEEFGPFPEEGSDIRRLLQEEYLLDYPYRLDIENDIITKIYIQYVP